MRWELGALRSLALALLSAKFLDRVKGSSVSYRGLRQIDSAVIRANHAERPPVPKSRCGTLLALPYKLGTDSNKYIRRDYDYRHAAKRR